MNHDKMVVIGEVIKPHGIRGEFHVENHADSPRFYEPGSRLWLRPAGAAGRGASGAQGDCLPARGASPKSSGRAQAVSGAAEAGANRRPGGGGSAPVQAVGRGKGQPARERVVTVISCRPHQGRLLVSIEGVNDRDAADALRGMEVLVRASDLPAPDEDEVYLHEIVGFDVVLPDGAKVGVLEAFLDSPGQDLWLIRADDGREILLPATEETVPEIDMDGRRIVIDPPPGLLELY